MAQGGSEGGGRYVAFISYSHKDAAVGRWLHRRLETYRVPKRLVGSEGEHGPVPARLTPIFRDREELPAAGDLSEKVRAALVASHNLIVVCSPNSAGSPWVTKEIETFRALHPDRPIFAAIVEGDPAQCFPPALSAGGRIEPLAADLRKEGDGRRLGVLKLVAGLAGVGLDALVQRDAQRHLRRVTAVTLAAVAMTLVMALLTIFAFRAQAEAERQRSEAEGLVEFMLTDLRDRLVGVSGLNVLTAVNQRALDYYQGQSLGGLAPESLERRARILHAMGEDDEDRGNLDRALAQFQEAKRVTAALMAADPNNPDRVFGHAQSEYWVGRIDEQRGNYDAALVAYRRYRDLAETMNRLRPRDTKFVAEMAFAESNLGIVNLRGFNRPAAARPHFQASLRLFQRVARLDPANREWRSETADAHAWVADTWLAEKRYAEARASGLEERRIKDALLALDPGNHAYRYAAVGTMRALARIEVESGKPTVAEPLLRQARSEMAALLRADPDNETWRTQAARVEADFAEIFLLTGRPVEFDQAVAGAYALLESETKDHPPSAAQQKLLSRLQEMAARRAAKGSRRTS